MLFATPDHAETPLPTQIRHPVEAFGMARHEQQQQFRPAGAQPGEGIQHLLVLASVGAGGDPDRTMGSQYVLAELPTPLQQIIGQGQVVLEITCNFHPWCAQRPKSLSIGLGLGGDQGDVLQHGGGQPANPGITARRTFRQPGVGDQRRNAGDRALPQQVRPQLGFHDQRQAGAGSSQKPRYRTGQIIRRVDMVNPLAQCLAHLAGAGQGGSGHQQRQIGIAVQQRPDQRQGGAGFAHRHGMNPQAA